MNDKQQQKAGDSSQQLQVAGDFYLVQNITEDRAREIAAAEARKIIAEVSAEAESVGMARIEHFDRRLIERLVASGRLDALADPGFIVTMKRAQLGAASTERESDYEMLAALLEDRAERGDVRAVRAGISRAVEIVDQIDESALVGLTVFAAATQYIPNAGAISEGLNHMDALFGQLLAEGEELPTDNDWLDHLDILDSVRANPVMTLKKFDEYYPALMPGYLASGVEAGSSDEQNAIQKLQGVGVRLPVVAHELKPGFKRLALARLDQLESLSEGEMKDVTLQVAQDAYGLGVVQEDLKGPFMELVEARQHLKSLRAWWDQLPMTFNLTGVGRVLARANAERLDGAGLLPSLH